MLLERYVRFHLLEASQEDRISLTRLLELPDPVLADYLLGHATATDPSVSRLVTAIREYRPSAGGEAGVRQ